MMPPKLRASFYIPILLAALLLISVVLNFVDILPRPGATRNAIFQTNYGLLEVKISESAYRSPLVLGVVDNDLIVWGPREPIVSQESLRINVSGIEKPFEIFHTLKLPNERYLYLFDLQDDSKGRILASLVIERQDGCVEFQILRWNSVYDEGVVAWKSKLPCIRLTGKSVGWHDFQGKLGVVSDSKVLLTTGLLIADTKIDAFPNPGFEVPRFDSLRGLMNHYNFFGMVHSVDLEHASSEILAIGLRGPSGVTRMGDSDRVFVADHGPRGGDELNLLSSATSKIHYGKADYGWPQSTYGLSYNYDLPPGMFEHRVPFNQKSENWRDPEFVWSPSVAPQNLVDGSKFGRPILFKELVIMGSLKAKSLFFIDISDDGRVRSVEQVEIGFRIRDMQLTSNELIASTDTGEILVIHWKPLPGDVIGQYPPINERDTNYWVEQVKFIVKSLTSWAFA